MWLCKRFDKYSVWIWSINWCNSIVGELRWYSALGGNYYFPRPRLALISCVSQEFASRISRMIISMVIFPEWLLPWWFFQKYNFQKYYSLRPRLVLISCVSQEFASISNPQDDLRTNTVWNSLPPTIWNELEADISANKNHLQMDVASW